MVQEVQGELHDFGVLADWQSALDEYNRTWKDTHFNELATVGARIAR